MQEGEREEAGRGSASRASRRVQGLPPEETKSLDEVKREARKANAAKRKAAEEKKKLSAAEEQSSPDWTSKMRTKYFWTMVQTKTRRTTWSA
ncbi:hypothetical protein PF001_g31199 [Phytophthora fragariae]|uniref:Uncharacterized protein n=1 Tax=Phytophthora fragariae TaxID=53985 RepID=A0A6A4B033_9STRA|nr:hypothetical protein PF001_g31199 [Phytophthora fragariae]